MKDNENEKIYACWLDSINFITSAHKYRLFEAAGSVSGIYDMSESDITFFTGEKVNERIKQAKNGQNPEDLHEKLQKSGIKHTFCDADDFPKRFSNIPDPPFGLLYRGGLPDDDTPCVAMIGTRKCSEYGHFMAHEFAQCFGKRGVSVISGMALGIDGISQRAAVDAGGHSYAVLGCGVDVVYPKSNKPLYDKLLTCGGVISEYPSGMEPRPALFPPRNRIISALSDVVLVVEAREKSGTLITVDMALEQGRGVYVVPGRCTDHLSGGCNMLLRQGASAALCAEDIISDMGWENIAPDVWGDKKKQVSSYIKGLSPLARAICGIVDIIPLAHDTIIMMLREQGFKESVAVIGSALVELELSGAIERTGGQYKLSL